MKTRSKKHLSNSKTKRAGTKPDYRALGLALLERQAMLEKSRRMNELSSDRIPRMREDDVEFAIRSNRQRFSDPLPEVDVKYMFPLTENVDKILRTNKELLEQAKYKYGDTAPTLNTPLPYSHSVRKYAEPAFSPSFFEEATKTYKNRNMNSLPYQAVRSRNRIAGKPILTANNESGTFYVNNGETTYQPVKPVYTGQYFQGTSAGGKKIQKGGQWCANSTRTLYHQALNEVGGGFGRLPQARANLATQVANMDHSC